MKTVIATFATLLLVGCSSSYEQETPEPQRPLTRERPAPTEVETSIEVRDVSDDNLRVEAGTLTGTIGPMTSFAEEASISLDHGDAYSRLDMVVSNEHGSAMILLDFYGSLTHEDLVDGYENIFYPPNSDPDLLHVTGLGCAGTGVPYQWSYDDPIQLLILRVNEVSPGLNELSVVAEVEGELSYGSMLYSHDAM